MKKLLIVAFGLLLLSSCEKRDRKEKNCPVVDNVGVPSVVTESFRTKYPNTSVEKWFNKDGNGFVALFTSSGTKKTGLFNNDGGFVKEENANDENSNDDKENGCQIEEGDND